MIRAQMRPPPGPGRRRLSPAVLAGLLTLAMGAAVAVPSAATALGRCSVPPARGGHAMHIVFQGRTRFVLVHVPAGIPTGRRVPLLLAFHGAGGNGGAMERYSGFSHQADLHRFIAAYPNAAGPTWNITAARDQADDVTFVNDVIQTLEQGMCIDPHRIYAAGISNGGGMVALLGCALSGELAAIAPVSGIYDGQPSCRLKHPVSVLEIHGTADQIAPYFGTQTRASGGGLPPYVKSWVHRDGCSTNARAQGIAARTTEYRWLGCADDTVVEHVRILGGAHQWPGALPPDPGPPSTICGACTIWSFFSSLPEAASTYSGGSGLPG
jgi:polyhydroxybutyrate depolymerase